jgi:hypothetical protein
MNELNVSPGSEWMSVVRASGTPDFAKAFSIAPVLEASVLSFSCVGTEAISIFFEATRGMYSSIAFVREARSERKTYLEWEGIFRGEKVGGLTLLSRDAVGVIDHVTLYHQPLSQVIRFAEALHHRLGAQLNAFRKNPA